MKRYDRQMAMESWGEETQNKLSESTVLIAGMGGLGSPVSLYLAAAGVGSLILWDDDFLDMTNLNRQILYREYDNGSRKVEAAARELRNLNSTVSCCQKKETIHLDSLASLRKKPSVIVDCLDSFSTRHILNAYAVKENIPLIHGAVEDFRGQLFTMIPGKTACLSCFLPREDSGTKKTIVGAAAGVIGSWQALEVIKLITGFGSDTTNSLYFWDGLKNSQSRIYIEKNRHCQVCGN